MSLKAIAWFCCLAGLWLPGAFGFSSDGSSLERKTDRWTVRTNSEVVFTVTFTNAAPAPLRGFFYTDELPSALAIRPISVTIDGQSVTNYTFEIGQDGDAYPGSTPCRWIIEQPPDFLQNNSISPQGSLQIVYAATSPVAETFTLSEYSWAAYSTVSTNASFGHSETVDQLTINFLSDPPPCLLALAITNSRVTLQLNAPSGCTYVIEATTNLLEAWTPVATNVTPVTLSEPATSGQRFYRAVWLP